MGHTVLVVDAEMTEREALCAILRERLSYNAAAVAQGREAAQYVMNERSLRPDIVLFDISGVAGAYEAIASLTALTAHMPVIVLVKYGDYEAGMKAIGAGAQDFLTKPVPAERLSTTLRNALLLRDARQEAESLRRGRVPVPAAVPGRAEVKSEPLSFLAEDGHIRRMEMLEAAAIHFAMQYYNGRMSEVARRLGIGRSTLYRKLNEFSLKLQEAAA